MHSISQVNKRYKILSEIDGEGGLYNVFVMYISRWRCYNPLNSYIMNKKSCLTNKFYLIYLVPSKNSQ